MAKEDVIELEGTVIEALPNAMFSVEIPGRAKSLISLRKATGSAKFENSVDMQTARENGVRQALYQAARNITAQVTEAW